MKTKLKFIVFLLLSIVVGLGIPYLIQFKLHFFGANFVSMGDIVGLWLTCLFIVLGIFTYVFYLKD